MPYMELCARRVRKHFETVKLFVDFAFVELVCMVFFPIFLPFFFDFRHVHKNLLLEDRNLLFISIKYTIFKRN